MRGFVITILSMSLIMMLVVLAMSHRNTQLSTERSLIEPLPLIYAAFLLDSVAYEFNSMVGPQLDLREGNESMNVTVKDILQSHNYSAEINGYDAFLSGEVADRTASSISANFSNLSGGVITLFINEDYTYTNDHTTNESLFTRENGTGATLYDINFTITAVRANVTHMDFNSSGTMNVTIIYTDLNGTDTEQGSVFPNQPNTFRVDYANGGSMTITIGLVSGNSGSLRMKTDGIGADTTWSTVLPPLDVTKKMGYEYDAIINYTQGNVNLFRRIGK